MDSFTLFFFFCLLAFNDIKYFLESWFVVGVSDSNMYHNMMVFRYILLPEYVKYSNFFPDRVNSDKLIGYVLIRNLFPFFFFAEYFYK